MRSSVNPHMKLATVAGFVGIGLLLLGAASAGARAGAVASEQAGGKGLKGGTLKLGTTQDPGIDPQKTNYQAELFWCCLTRTLVTYNLRPPTQGGTVLHPDLAVSLPKVTNAGRTYTFKLKRGIHYGPPFQRLEVTSQDIRRALQREADPAVAAPNASSFSAIDGWDVAVKTSGSPIAGVSTPDRYTIVFRLSKASGTFLYALADPASGPIPPRASTGHEKDYGRFVVSTGPYMVAGSETLNFGVAPAQQKPLSGYQPNRFLRLVRNPSWSAKSDRIRQANPDVVEFSIGGTVQDIAQKVTAGVLDELFIDQAPAQVVQQYSTTPSLRKRLHVNPKPFHTMVGMFNLAQPPFDDVHVRRAANFIIDRDAIIRALGGATAGTAAYHFLPDATIGYKLRTYAPYKTNSASARLAAAQAEMKNSKYDPGKTGSCTDPVCRNPLVIALFATGPLGTLVKNELAQIGIQADMPSYDVDTGFGKCADPKQHVALCLQLTFGASKPNGVGIAELLLSSGIGGCCDLPLLGATPQQLNGWGYTTSTLPSVDADVERCRFVLGSAADTCWANFDKRVSDQLAAIMPIMFPRQTDITSARVVNYSYDLYGFMSLNTVAVKH
jgi:peptide/nickel transport system substrate-binding protein